MTFPKGTLVRLTSERALYSTFEITDKFKVIRDAPAYNYTASYVTPYPYKKGKAIYFFFHVNLLLAYNNPLEEYLHSL